MTIEWVPSGKVNNPRITPSIKFDELDDYYDATIYYDHIAVAYFAGDGSIKALPLECGPYTSGGEEESVQYLKDHGVELIKLPTGKDDKAYTNWCIKLGV